MTNLSFNLHFGTCVSNWQEYTYTIDSVLAASCCTHSSLLLNKPYLIWEVTYCWHVLLNHQQHFFLRLTAQARVFSTAELVSNNYHSASVWETCKQSHSQEWTVFSLTCLQSEASRLRLLVEIVRLIVMPANCRLLFPRMDVRQRDVGCKEKCVVRQG